MNRKAAPQMHDSYADASDVIGSDRPPCVEWCIADHGSTAGEEDWVHISEPCAVAPGTTARLCMSIDPVAGAEDGPYVVITVESDAPEYTLPEAESFAASVVALARRGARALPAGLDAAQ